MKRTDLHTTRPGNRLTGFTVLELLAAIVVIAVLAGILLPATVGAQAKSLGASCMSQSRQLSLAFVLYCDDHSDSVPPNKDGQGLLLGETWVEGWLGLPGPDCTNLLFLQRSLLGSYIGTPGIWRCPATRPTKVGGATQLRVRTFSINGFIGSPVDSPVAKSYRKRSDFVSLSPSELLSVVEERAETINDGAFSQQWDFREDDPSSWMLRDQTATLHQRGGTCSFADGHVEIHHWLDFLRSNPNRNDQPAPGNRDILWLERHATSRKAEP
jgi:prepilin-type processing-associated H-X9-DG protein